MAAPDVTAAIPDHLPEERRQPNAASRADLQLSATTPGIVEEVQTPATAEENNPQKKVWTYNPPGGLFVGGLAGVGCSFLACGECGENVPRGTPFSQEGEIAYFPCLLCLTTYRSCIEFIFEAADKSATNAPTEERVMIAASLVPLFIPLSSLSLCTIYPTALRWRRVL